ncbi:hypothetical protein PNEG_00009 [Pneumocystis murina B123]|uniref:Uncharacterized protein n=1 Tax=Pneumocystis murina (strain B123) TaxID=1069680 RepID=M7PCD2_PNEMU|nr:hypothetical protein PNEG_00009 [Pneumocystis murina B123]EMR11565.1 hypothetical protein PNEG_00009 [Pneumocystis murina B123]
MLEYNIKEKYPSENIIEDKSYNTKSQELHNPKRKRKNTDKVDHIARIVKINYIQKNGQKEPVCTLTDGSVLYRNDTIYLVSEPPGEPYYLARIMEFTSMNNDPDSSINAIRVNWFYRPRDVQKKTNDSRQLFASMHSDICPLSAYRGKCRIFHKDEIENHDEYRKIPNSFYYDRLFDRYIYRYYEVVPIHKVTNVPDRVKEVLRQEWKYVIVEIGRGKELAMQHRGCKRCGNWCLSIESIRCAVCHDDYHMHCVKPPLLKKPTKGFVWTCTSCSRAEHRRIKANKSLEIPSERQSKTINLRKKSVQNDVDNNNEDSELSDISSISSNITESNNYSEINEKKKYKQPTEQQKAITKLWPYRYLGIHCNIEDVLDYDDRIYPRAASRIGGKHQAVIPEQDESFIEKQQVVVDLRKKRKGKHIYKFSNASEEEILEQTNSEAKMDNTKVNNSKECFPKPSNSKSLFNKNFSFTNEIGTRYVLRGHDHTSIKLFSKPENIPDDLVDNYLNKIKYIAENLSIPHFSTDFQDIALTTLYENQFDINASISSLSFLTKKHLRIPDFNVLELEQFENAISQYGSELSLVANEIPTKSLPEIIKFYYIWKKTESGKKIWGNYSGRRKKEEKLFSSNHNRSILDSSLHLTEDIADSSDDSAYNSEKATLKHKSFICKFCSITKSKLWKRAPGGSFISDKNVVTALCQRCGELWRKYSVRWEPPEEIAKKLSEPGARWRKKKFEEELLKEQHLFEEKEKIEENCDKNGPGKRRRLKTDVKYPKKDIDDSLILKGNSISCRVCELLEPKSILYTCKTCELMVHKTCYGISYVDPNSWICDMCINDKTPMVSTNYQCVLCSVHDCPSLNSNSFFREALKQTSGNNWAHVTCAIWIPELKFTDSSTLQPIEGIGAISLSRWQQVCFICKKVRGVCALCHVCHIPLHVTCAIYAGYTIGFDIALVKGSRKDNAVTIKFSGEFGIMTAAIWCPNHNMKKTIVHAINEYDYEINKYAIKAYVENYKTSMISAKIGNRRINMNAYYGHITPLTIAIKLEELRNLKKDQHSPIKEVTRSCYICETNISPVWWPKNNVSTSTNNLYNAKLLYACHLCYYTMKKKDGKPITKD